jgi:hypothetical protein
MKYDTGPNGLVTWRSVLMASTAEPRVSMKLVYVVCMCFSLTFGHAGAGRIGNYLLSGMGVDLGVRELPRFEAITWAALCSLPITHVC